MKISSLSPRIRGFTIVELIIIIIVVGILAVSAYPLIGGRSGVDAAVYQGQVISLLRLQQQRAMQDTVDNGTYGFTVAATEVNTEPFDNELTITSDNSDIFTISSGYGTYYFDAMGCLVRAVPNNERLCGRIEIITITADSTRTVVINEQGYIQAPN